MVSLDAVLVVFTSICLYFMLRLISVNTCPYNLYIVSQNGRENVYGTAWISVNCNILKETGSHGGDTALTPHTSQ